MDFLNHFNPLHHQRNELLLQIPSITQQDMIFTDPPTHHHESTKHHQLCRKSFQSSNHNDQPAPAAKKKLKITHREVERQRRHEMANLFRSLQSLVPSQYLQGKRSISDRMNEATIYIKHQQKKIQELVKRRNQLKPLSNTHTRNHESVTVQPCSGGVEIVIKEQAVPLSKILGLLIEEGCNVVSCASIKVNHISYYSIQTEVTDTTEVDLSVLEHKLIYLNRLPKNQIHPA